MDKCPRCGQRMENPHALYCLSCAMEDLERYELRAVDQDNDDTNHLALMPGGHLYEYRYKVLRELKRGNY